MSEPTDSPEPTADRRGRATRNGDPTANVLDLVDAAVKRQDDMRELDGKWRDAMDDLRAAHSREMGRKESERIDAIRAVDVGNVQRAAEVQATQALTLASQVTTSAEALRTQVATTATAFDSKLSLALEPIQKRIDDLSRAQYETAGQKTQVSESRERGGSFGLWIGLAVAGMVGFATVVIGAVTLILLLMR